MFRKLFSAIIVLTTLACAAHAQAKTRRVPYGLPAGALVVETRALELGGGRPRALVLWMLKPKKYPRDTPGEPYTCPEETRGSFYRGPARLSLVDTAADRVVNTLRILQEYDDDTDEFDLPFRIKAGGYYHVGGVAEGREARPTIMWLRDLNGDGRAHEFALFDALACMGLPTALFGYSESQDRVVQYTVALETTGVDGKKGTELNRWVDYLFAKEPVGPGRWRFEIDYRGRGGSLDRYDVHYNTTAERFEGTATFTGGEQ